MGWSSAPEPLAAVAVAGHGAVGAALGERATHRNGSVVVEAPPWVVVRGDDLPWADGAVYLGSLPGAEPLLVPVHRRPVAPPEVLLAAVRRLASPDPGPFALLPGDGDGDAGPDAELPVDVVVLS